MTSSSPSNGEGAKLPQAVGLRPTTARLPTAAHRWVGIFAGWRPVGMTGRWRSRERSSRAAHQKSLISEDGATPPLLLSRQGTRKYLGRDTTAVREGVSNVLGLKVPILWTVESLSDSHPSPEREAFWCANESVALVDAVNGRTLSLKKGTDTSAYPLPSSSAGGGRSATAADMSSLTKQPSGDRWRIDRRTGHEQRLVVVRVRIPNGELSAHRVPPADQRDVAAANTAQRRVVGTSR